MNIKPKSRLSKKIKADTGDHEMVFFKKRGFRNGCYFEPGGYYPADMVVIAVPNFYLDCIWMLAIIRESKGF